MIASTSTTANLTNSDRPGLRLAPVGLASARPKGHQITVRTTYEITVDGRPFAIHATVDDNGRVHYHGLPTRDFPSIIGLIQKAIDMFPDDFPEPAWKADPDNGSHHHEHHDESS
jgi:hypothetical protein